MKQKTPTFYRWHKETSWETQIFVLESFKGRKSSNNLSYRQTDCDGQDMVKWFSRVRDTIILQEIWYSGFIQAKNQAMAVLVVTYTRTSIASQHLLLRKHENETSGHHS